MKKTEVVMVGDDPTGLLLGRQDHPAGDGSGADLGCKRIPHSTTRPA
ncbi:hypothetical protein ACWC09_51455 [Streptomyces sp. NPDC001617]